MRSIEDESNDAECSDNMFGFFNEFSITNTALALLLHYLSELCMPWIYHCHHSCYQCQVQIDCQNLILPNDWPIHPWILTMPMFVS